VLPTDEVEALECLVDEVERVSTVGERPLGRCCKQSVGKRGWREPSRNRCEQGTLGRLAMAHACPTLEPALECSRIRPAFKRRTFAPWRLAVAVRCHAARAMEQRKIDFLLGQHEQEIGERSQDRQTHAPAVAVQRAKQRDLADNFRSWNIGRELTMHGLGDNETKVVCEAVPKPLAPMRGGIGMIQRGFHPHFAIAQFDGEGRHVVGPKVKGAAAFEIEAGVMPMTGQDAVFDAAQLERKTHVWAPIVEGENAAAIVDDQDRTMDAVQNEPALCLELIKAAGEHEFPARRVHKHCSRDCYDGLSPHSHQVTPPRRAAPVGRSPRLSCIHGAVFWLA
jgi:hypothetical protein